jgi:hypothetical protein
MILLKEFTPDRFLELSGDIDRSKVFEKVMEKQFEGKEIKKIECKFYNLGKHTFSKEMREEAYKWIETWTSIQTNN